MGPEILEEEQLPPNVRTGCICPNGGRPIRGLIYIEPACRVHYAEKNIPYAEDDAEITKAELAEWAQIEKGQRRKRVTYPKMKVATS
jgi:hypothetical protein